jgi:hypothetical protein
MKNIYAIKHRYAAGFSRSWSQELAPVGRRLPVKFLSK